MSRRADIRDERGVATVMVVLLLPVFLVMAAFVVNAGRWWVVDRHMQTQADAAALAAGTELANDPLHCTAARVENRARQYGGINTAVDSEAAAQFNAPGEVNTPTADYEPNFRFNSAGYAIGGTPDADAASFTGANADPCVSGIADVKLTTAQVPAILRMLDIKADVHAHARVALLKAGMPRNAAPFGIETADPKRVFAEVVNLADGSVVPVYNAAGAPLAGLELTKGAAADGTTTWATNASYTVRASSAGRLGIRLRLSDAAGSVDCANASVTCLGSLSTIRVYSDPNAAGVTGVRAGVVGITPSACDAAAGETGYFHTTCTSVRVAAHVLGLDRTKGGTVTINGGAATYDTSSPAGDPTWVATVPVTVGSGANDITLAWEQTSGTMTKDGVTVTCTNKKSSNPCKGTIADAHRTFSGGLANANVVKHVDVAIGTGVGATSNNLRAGTCTAGSPCPIAISTALGGSVSLAKATDPAIALRLGDSGSLTGLLDCDPVSTSAAHEIATGCGTGTYVENTGQNCTAFGNAGQLFASPSPWPCAATEQGNKVSQIPRGMTARILCSDDPESCLGNGPTPACTAKNHWPDFDADDPRIVPMFLVPVGSAAMNGATVYPVLAFAAFYVTGWTGSPCTGADNEIPAQYAGDKASVFGHWIKYIAPDLDSPTNAKCDLQSLAICTPVLVK